MSLVIPSTAFERAAVRYIRHQKALELQFRNQTYVLRRVAHLLAGQRDLDAERFEVWMRSLEHASGTMLRCAAFAEPDPRRHRTLTASRVNASSVALLLHT